MAYQQIAQIFYYSSRVLPNPEFISNASLHVCNGSDGVSRVNLTALVIVDLLRPTLLISIFIRRTGSREFNDLYYQSQINLCKMDSEGLGGVLLRIVMKSLEMHSNFRLRCRIEKKLVYVKIGRAHV